jgi:hypothetical protein
LIAYLYHFQMMNPIFPDAEPWDNFLFIIAAVIIVWLNRRTMSQRGSGVTDVLMPEQGAEYHSGDSLRMDPSAAA